jgi:hypothetical protein
MSLLNRILNWFGLGKREDQVPVTPVTPRVIIDPVTESLETSVITNNDSIIEPTIESQETRHEDVIAAEEPAASVKPKTTTRGRPKSSATKKTSDTKKATGTRKPRTPRKSTEE